LADINELICNVIRPARYLGGEAGSVVKDPDRVRLSLALAFPDTYEIGMSHLGLKVLYEMLAPRPEVAAERVFAPWVDLMDLLEKQGQAPWSLETGRLLNEFDVIGFSLQYELTYTNMLHMLRLAGIPLRRDRRSAAHPVIIAGGPCLVNPEPVADFLDLAVVGEAEELINPLVDLLLAAKEEGWERPELYRRAAELEGVYVPALYEPIYENGRLKEIKALDEARPRVRRRVVPDLESVPPPVSPVVPWVQVVHDRLGLEIARGCTRGCRFCQAGYIYRPVRERAAVSLAEAALTGLGRTGFEELALLSLSSGDYTCIEPLCTALMDALASWKISLSLPSLRMDSLSQETAAQIKRVRKTGFTLAPEAGSERLRQVINKGLNEEQILATARQVYGLGWNLIKLYFMLGLPTETEADLAGIGELCRKVAAEAKQAKARRRGRGPVVHASLGVFVPKPHTPFQWEPGLDLAEAEKRLDAAKSSLGSGLIKAKWNSPRQSVLESVLARGDRRLSRALELAVELGCRFDGWSEELNYDAWLRAISGAGLSLAEYLRARDLDECLPWDHLDIGVDKKFLLAEREKSLACAFTPDCRSAGCQECGVCDFRQIKPRLAGGGDVKLSPSSSPSPDAPENATYRFRLAKTGLARFLGHLEMMTQLARAFRRAGVEVAHSQGFNPRPLIKTDSALPLGVESLAESLQVTVVGRPKPEDLVERVNQFLPQGLRVFEARFRLPGERLNEPKEVTYQIGSSAPLAPDRLEAFLAAGVSELARSTPKKGVRVMDLKAALKQISLQNGVLTVVVGRAGGRPKPAEILEAVFGLSPEEAACARALKVGAGY